MFGLIEGASFGPPGTVEAYAADLARKVRLSFPTLVVERMIEKDDLSLGARHSALKAPVTAFLELRNRGSAGAVTVTFERDAATVGHVRLSVPA